MAKSFVSVFKLDGVPILPPMINDEVRAMVASYRQKAIEIEKRIEERKKIPIQIDTKTSDQDDGDPAVFQDHPAMNEQDDTHGYPLCDELSSIETTTAASNNTTIENEDWSDSPGKLHEEPSRTLTPAKVESDSHRANEGTVEKPRTKRKPSSRTTSICSTGSGTSERIDENVAHVLTAHEHRMRELLKRQEEERLLLEKSFREKTQELVALCSKSLTTASPFSNFPAGSITPELNPASSVSQLSLCNMSYNSCTDTDDAAYQSCHANGTSEENVAGGESMLNNSLAKPDADRALISDRALSLNTTRTNDVNGNERFALLPQRVKQLQQHQAATIINAYARGYLTRRLLRTEEVQTLKRTIVDIVCFIVHSWSQENGTADATVRRSAGKHFAFCLDRLHDIFINYSPAQRVQMIRRDRYLKSKATTVPH
uniref:Uncharacterized protein n=1 Tax=Anopheles atroparvus TaxID=41427 RepID=A0A182JDB6_ANOAO